MALTTPDNIWTPDAGEQYALTTDLATTADSIQNAITEKANYGVGTTAEMNAAVNRFPDGAMWYNTTNDTEYRRVAGIWVAQDVDTGWVDITTLLNEWQGANVAYRVINGVCHLGGQIWGGNNGLAVFNLPSSVLPRGLEVGAVIGRGSSPTGYSSTFGRISVVGTEVRFSAMGASANIPSGSPGLGLSSVSWVIG